MDYYERVLELIKDVTSKTKELTILLREKNDQDITEQQADDLGQALADFTITMKGFGQC